MSTTLWIDTVKGIESVHINPAKGPSLLKMTPQVCMFGIMPLRLKTKKQGMRQIRDSIFVDQADNGFKVTNRKWRLNDYDQEGWVSMEHADDRPMPTFLASYDETSASLISFENVSEPILIDHKNGKLFRNKSKDVEYLKVE